MATKATCQVSFRVLGTAAAPVFCGCGGGSCRFEIGFTE